MDDSRWQPPASDQQAPQDAPEPGDAPAQPALPTLPASGAPVPAAPDPPSAWAPGGEVPIVVPDVPSDPPAPPSPWAPGGQAPPDAPGLPSIPPPSIPPPPVPPAPVPAPPDTGGERPIIEPMAAPPSGRDRRSKWLVGSAAASVVAVGAAGIFAVANLTGAAAGGGATPADLGNGLLAAIEGEDVLGVIDVLAPGERRALGEPFIDLVTELQRLDVLAETDLSRIAGLDVDLTNEIVRTRVTNVDDIVNVEMSADVEISIDGATLPIGSLITDNMGDDMLTEMRGTRVTETSEFDITLTAVLEDERWYFSLFHTIAELARDELTDDVGIPAEGVGADGAASPEAAVDQLLDRVEALDLTGVIRSLDPGEAAALQRYAPLFLEDAQIELDEAPFEWAIVDRTVRVAGSGDRRTAFVDALAIEGSLDGSPFEFGFEGDCVVAEMEGDRFEQCGDVGGVSDVEDVFGDEPEITNLIETVQAAFDDVEPIGLELRRRDGGWFVSPLATGSEAMLKVLRALDRQELDQIIEAFEPALEAIADGVSASLDELAGAADLDLSVPLDPGLPFGDEADDPFGDTSSDGFGWFACYELDTVDATACFQSYVDSGEIVLTDIPVVLRYPECGYAEPSWGGSVYQLPDERFVEVVDGARACFLDLVETGQVEEWELPEEIAHFECFEGRNWYQVFDDPEYDQRFDACRSAALDR